MSTSSSTRDSIIEQITRLFIAADNRAWDTLQNIFAEKVLLDYSSMGGGEPASLFAGQIVDAWKQLLPGFDATHHQLGNFLVDVDGDKATLFCYGTATHYLAAQQPNLWTVVGSYHVGLTRTDAQWRITAFKFNFKYQDGNTHLPRLARERAKSS